MGDLDHHPGNKDLQSCPAGSYHGMRNQFLPVGMLFTLALLASVHAGEIKRDLLREPRISEEQASKIALQQVKNGKIESHELENEDGKRVWSFDIETPGTKDITEVQVDANTGEVVSKKIEEPSEQKKEKEEDSKG